MSDTRRTKAGHGFWQVTGVGDLRHTVLGTMEKTVGGWLTVPQHGVSKVIPLMKLAQEYLLEQYGRYAARIVTLQPTAHVDHITDDGDELTRLPFPFHVNVRGEIQRQDFWKGNPERVIGFVSDLHRQDFWKGNPERVIGFVSDLHRQEVDLDWDEVFRDPQRAVGQYVITQDKSGTWATHTLAIWKAEAL